MATRRKRQRKNPALELSQAAGFAGLFTEALPPIARTFVAQVQQALDLGNVPRTTTRPFKATLIQLKKKPDGSYGR